MEERVTLRSLLDRLVVDGGDNYYTVGAVLTWPSVPD